MKIKVVSFFLMFFVSLSVMSQNRGDVRIGTYGQIFYLDHSIIPQYGLSGEIFVADNFSLVYKYGLGTNVNGDITGHINPAIFLLAFTATSPAAIFGTLLISEGVSYHIAVNEFIEFAPYLNPLGAEVNLYPDKPFLLSCSVGVNMFVKYITPFNNISLTPYGGAVIIYRDGNVIPVAGFSVYYTF